MKDIKIIVGSHKEYKMPKDNMYIPLHLGSEGSKEINGFQKDNAGESISIKNPFFCELTGLYWAWKNLDAKYIGLVHYRRHLTTKNLVLTKNEDKKFEKLLTHGEADKLLSDVDIILPKKRKYYIENIYDHYKHTNYIETLDETEKIIQEKYPEYLDEFKKIHKRTSAHMFNIFVMKKEILNDYCTWLFDILFELEKRVDEKKYDKFHARFYGRISEILLDVYIYKNNLKFKEINVIDMQNINWFNKITSFLKAKFLNKKYASSF